MACKRRRWRGLKPVAFFMRVVCRRMVPFMKAASGALEAQRWAVTHPRYTVPSSPGSRTTGQNIPNAVTHHPKEHRPNQ